MRASLLKTQPIRVAVIESDPLRFVGLHACLGSESDFELSSSSLSEAGAQQNIDVVLLGTHPGSNLFEVVATLKAARPGLRIIVMGAGMGEENILKAIASGAKGYIDEAAGPSEFRPGVPGGKPRFGVGASASALSIHRTGEQLIRAYLPCGPSEFYAPRKRDSKNGSRGPIE